MNKRLVRIDDTRAMELTTYTPEPSKPAYPAFDTAKPTDAERIAELEARVEKLEAALKKLRIVDWDYKTTESGNVMVTPREVSLTE